MIGHIGLVTVLVGDDPASDVYIRLKHKAAVEAGFDATDLRLPAETTEEALLAKLDELNGSDDVDAILVQLPLPDHIDEARDHPRGHACEGRRRLPSDERRRAVPRPAGDRLGDTARRDGAPRRASGRARRRPRRRDRPQRDRRQARLDAPAAGERHRHALPLAHARSRAAHPRRRRARGRRRASRRSSRRTW